MKNRCTPAGSSNQAAEPNAPNPIGHFLRLYLVGPACLLLCLAVYGQASGQSPDVAARAFHGQVRFRILTSENGLSRSTVWSIARDRKGFVYFGTWSGFNRYDGQSFVVHKRGESTDSGLMDNQARSLYADEEDKIWIGTNNGVSVYEPESEQVRAVPAINQKLPHPNVLALTGRGDWIWVGTRQGLLSYQRSSGAVRIYDRKTPSGLDECSIRSLAVDRVGRLWVGTQNGLFQQRGTSFEAVGAGPEPERRLSNQFIRAIHADQKYLWLGTEGGLNRYELETGLVRIYRHDPKLKNGLHDNWINAILSEPSGALWIGGREGGLARFDPESESFFTIQRQLDDPFSIPSNDVVSLMLDGNGLLWVGTYLGGVGILDLHPARFQSLVQRPELVRAIRQAQALAENEDGRIWVGTQAGLVLLDPVSEEFQIFSHDPARPDSLSENQILTLLPEKGGSVWVGTYSGGIDRYDPQSGGFIHYDIPQMGPDSTYFRIVHSLFRDQKGQIWAASRGAPLVLNPVQNRFVKLEMPPKFPGLASRINALVFCERGKDEFWIGCDQGLFLKRGAEFKYFHKGMGQGSLSHNTVNTLELDGNQRLWVGTGNGLNLYEPESGTFQVLTTANGLPSNYINGLVAKDEALWISTSRGAARLKMEGEQIQLINFGMQDGLVSDDFYRNSTLVRKNGDLLFGGNGGVTIFHGPFLEHVELPPPIEITGFRLFDKPVKLSESINYTNKIELSHKNNLIAFDVAILDYRGSFQNKLLYRLKGFDEEWIHAQGRRFISYSNLGSGRYRLELALKRTDGKPPQPVKTLELVVIPPFWGTWWFRMSITLFVILLVGLLHRLREKKLETLTQNLEAMVQEKTAELESSKQRLLEVAHHAGIFEISSGVLNQIGDQLGNIKQRVRTIQAELRKSAHPLLVESHEQLQKSLDREFAEYTEREALAREVVEKIHDFTSRFSRERLKILEAAEDLERRVELIKDTIAVQHSYAKTPFYTQEVDLGGLVRDALRLEHGSLMELGVEVGAVVPDGIKIRVTRIKIMNVLTQILQNAVEAMAETQPPRRLEVRYHREGDGLHLIQIRDTGCGIHPDEKTKVFHANYSTKAQRSGLGLHEASNSMVELGGWLRLESGGLGMGATATIAIPPEPPQCDGKV